MMEDPWFTYFRGRGRMQITPRNAGGWAALLGFILLVTLPGLALPLALQRSEWLIVPYLVLVALLTFGFIRWAITKSELVDLDLSARDLAEFREWKRRGKR